MSICYQEPSATIYCGHALTELPAMPPESVDCVMTSPPYWGLRTYKTEPQIWGDNHCEHEWERQSVNVYENKSGQHWQAAYGGATGKNRFGYGNTDLSRQQLNVKSESAFCLKCHAWRGELGLEPTIELYISHLVQIFDEVKRVLKKTGTCWVVIDDSYASGKGTCFNPGGGTNSLEGHSKLKDAEAYPLNRGNKSALEEQGLLPKSLCLIPSRFALAMVEHGWRLRNDIVWYKSNPMPESVKDRFTGTWEHLFFFVKSQRYWFEQQFEPAFDWGTRDRSNYRGGTQDPFLKHHGLDNCNFAELGRNKRDVWQINTEPTAQWHGIKNFATFPEKLCETPILSGCPSQICKKCGKARERVYERTSHINKREPAHQPGNTPTKVDSTGWAPTEKPTNKYTDCGCNAGFEPGVVLDPFCGSGRALSAAKRLGRKAIGIDLNPDYCKLAVKEIEKISLPMELV